MFPHFLHSFHVFMLLCSCFLDGFQIVLQLFGKCVGSRTRRATPSRGEEATLQNFHSRWYSEKWHILKIFWEWGYSKVLLFPGLLDFLSLLMPRAYFLASWIFCGWSSEILSSWQFWPGGFSDSQGIICSCSFKFDLMNFLDSLIFWIYECLIRPRWWKYSRINLRRYFQASFVVNRLVGD